MDFMGFLTFFILIFSAELLLGDLLHMGHKDSWVWSALGRVSDYGKFSHVSWTYGEESGSAGPTPALLYAGAVMDLQPHAKFSS